MARKYRKRQLPGMRKKKPYSILPTCSRCGVRQGSWNSIRIANGRFASYCNDCNTDVGFMRRYRNLPQYKISDEIRRLKHHIFLLKEVLTGMKEGAI